MDRTDPWGVTDRVLTDRLRACRDDGTPAALATVVAVEGSAYRRPGAKLVATDDEVLGAITAGCLEGPVADLAAAAREEGTVSVETFDLMDDDEWGLGLGCNGVIDVLVEPVDDSLDPALAALSAHESTTLLTVVDSDDDAVPVGARSVVVGDTVRDPGDRSSIPPDAVADLHTAAERAQAEGWNGIVTVDRGAGTLRVFVDGLQPPPELLLFGSQNDVHTVARFAVDAGFRVTVASARGARSSLEQFPFADRVVTTHPSDLADVVEADDQTYAVCMSHNLLDDQLALESLVTETAVPYVGLMGPRERFEEVQDGLAADGVSVSTADLERISTPVGLDLGADGPTGIAMSVVAEVLAVANDASGGRLRDKTGPIHARPDPTP
jgi:xanthine dehydrogenase accessory factor